MSQQTNKILIRPIITEKATFLTRENKYIFAVAPTANKLEIFKAIEQTYKIKPIDVNIINVKGKLVRYGRTSGYTKKWKKAIVTLKPGDKIDLTTS